MIALVTEYFLAIALFFSFITLIFYGFPVAWTMGGLGVIFIIISMLSDSLFDTFYGVDWGFASMVVYRLYGVMANWVLVALPMFIFMGIMMDKSGIAEDLMTDLSKLFGKTRGGLAISIVFIGVLLAASTGIIGAAVVLLTILGVPLMLKNNYNPDLACGVVCATGTLGILIPPSIMLVIMGDQVRISVGDLFMGAVFPGLLLGLLYTIYIFVYAYMNPKAAPLPKDAEPVSIKIIFRVLKSIGKDINSSDQQIEIAGGYDHNYVINTPSLDSSFAKVIHLNSGRVMEVYTDQPGVQLYTGNFLKAINDNYMGKRSGFCLETQHFPDSPNQSNFPSIVLDSGEVYSTTTKFKFSVQD